MTDNAQPTTEAACWLCGMVLTEPYPAHRRWRCSYRDAERADIEDANLAAGLPRDAALWLLLDTVTKRARAESAAKLRALPAGITQHTCWDNHEGPNGGHLDGSSCRDDPQEFVSRDAAFAVLDADAPAEPPMTERDRFLWRRSVEIGAFEARTQEEDEAMWATAQRDADVLFGPAPEPRSAEPEGLTEAVQRVLDAECRCGKVSADAIVAAIRSAEPEGLDAAWADAEAALPEGWELDQLVNASRWWVAFAGRPFSDKGTDAKGETPAAALRALAAILREGDR